MPEDPCMDVTTFVMSGKDNLADKPALIDAKTGHTMTYSQLQHAICSVELGLVSIGVRQGDVVMLVSRNSVHYPVAFLATTSVGGVLATLNPLTSAGEAKKQAEAAGARFVIVEEEFVDKVAELGVPLVIIEKGDKIKVGSTESKISLGDPAALLYSSGTTGTSKGVVLTHRNLIAAAVLHAASGPDVEPGEVYLCVIPMFHVFGLVIVTCTQLSRGVPIVVMPSFDFEAMLGAIQRFKITHVPLVPPIVIALGKSPAVKAFDLSSLREIGSGAAPLGREVINACLERFPDVKVRQGYGLTESTAIASVADPDDLEHYGSAGLLSSNTLAKVIDVGSGRPLPPNQQGEIWIHGPTIMDEYLNNPNATAETVDAEGWLHTGDLGYFDDSGNLYVVDRIKELIKYKGFQVAPAELEALLLSHSQVVDAAVIPFPDEEAGQVPLAVIVRKQGCSLDGQGVMKFVSDQVAPYKKVRKVMFIDAIPKSASGKILRRELVQMTMPVSKL
ncbi:hypothetical protein SELMODRAFT_231716 [Selaginella moellendorffii]|uniref:4-coumarate--CoA ligase n=1 Tax=Selaginella moellendorffii TaxID=88036 RepID=D8RIL8_SELML|nr:hypothetical protein SELMODRAFT_231716 [Selaginella moellendorffii]